MLLISLGMAKTPDFPRQKIHLAGQTQATRTVSLGVSDLEKEFPSRVLKIHDPYNKNQLTVFYGLPLTELLNKYAAPATNKILVKAYDGYQVTIDRSEVSRTSLFLSYKDQDGYLSIKRMGPARIIAPFEGIINKDLLLKIGVNWVWQVKSIEFIN